MIRLFSSSSLRFASDVSESRLNRHSDVRLMLRCRDSLPDALAWKCNKFRKTIIGASINDVTEIWDIFDPQSLKSCTLPNY
jgi:hypothetical protein